MPNRLETLERLANLRDRGVLSDEEFAKEKADLFNEAPGQPTPSAPQTNAETLPAVDELIPPASQPRGGDVPGPSDERRVHRHELKALNQRLWSFERVLDAEEADLLLGAGWFAAGLVAFNGALDFGADLWTAATGGIVDPTLSNGDALTGHLLGWAIWLAVVGATAWGAVSRRNRFAAGFLIILASLELVVALNARWDGNATLRNAAFLICGPAIVMAIQCLRANIARRRLQATPV